MNEGPELWTALGGLVGLIGAAGITTQLQMMAEDPAISEAMMCPRVSHYY